LGAALVLACDFSLSTLFAFLLDVLSALGVGSASSESVPARVVSAMRDRIFRVIIRFLFFPWLRGTFLSGARTDPTHVRICPPANAMQTNAMTWALVFTWFSFFLLVLFSRFVTLVGDGMGVRSFMVIFQQTGLKVLRMGLNFSETL